MGNSLYLGDKYLGGTVIDDNSTDKHRVWSSEKVFGETNGIRATKHIDGYITADGVIRQEEPEVQALVHTGTTDYIPIPNSIKKLAAYTMATIDADVHSISASTSNSAWIAISFYDASKAFIERFTPVTGSAESPYKYGNKSIVFNGYEINENAKYVRFSWRAWTNGECVYVFSDESSVLSRMVDYSYRTDLSMSNVFNYTTMTFGYLSTYNTINVPTSGVEYTSRKAYTTAEFPVTGRYAQVAYTYYADEVINTTEWAADSSPSGATWGVWLALDKNKNILNDRPSIDNVFAGKSAEQLTKLMDSSGKIRRSFVLNLPEGTKYIRFSWRTYGINPTDAEGTTEANACYGLDMQVKTSQLVTISDVEGKLLPAAPTVDGNYSLRATVSSGTVTYSWVAE